MFWAEKFNVRSVLKCVFWYCTGPPPLFNLRPKSFIVSTKITKNQSLFLNSFIKFGKKYFYTASTNTSPFFSCKENTTLNSSRSSEGQKFEGTPGIPPMTSGGCMNINTNSNLPSWQKWPSSNFFFQDYQSIGMLLACKIEEKLFPQCFLYVQERKKSSYYI